jgi:hypothetical protein
MAGLGRKVFTVGEILTAANVNGYLMDQAVMVFDDATARSSALGTAVSEGMVSYRKDGDIVEQYNGSSWGPVGVDSFTTTGTAGNLLQSNGTAGVVWLANGANGQVLTVNGSTVGYEDRINPLLLIGA